MSISDMSNTEIWFYGMILDVMPFLPVVGTILVVSFYIGLSIVVGYGAHVRRRDRTIWTFLAIIITPLAAGFCLLMIGRKAET